MEIANLGSTNFEPKILGVRLGLRFYYISLYNIVRNVALKGFSPFPKGWHTCASIKQENDLIGKGFPIQAPNFKMKGSQTRFKSNKWESNWSRFVCMVGVAMRIFPWRTLPAWCLLLAAFGLLLAICLLLAFLGLLGSLGLLGFVMWLGTLCAYGRQQF